MTEKLKTALREALEEFFQPGRRSLCNRLMLSLITAGLVKGITPTSIRRRSGAPIQVIASWSRDGADAA